MGSLLSISRTDVSLSTPRFSAAPRLAGYQLSTYDVGAGTRTVSHDDAGRLSNDGTQGFVFDDLGALARVTSPGTAVPKESFLYDFQGRLVGRTDASSSDVFVHDGLQMVQSYSAAGVQQWHATWGLPRGRRRRVLPPR